MKAQSTSSLSGHLGVLAARSAEGSRQSAEARQEEFDQPRVLAAFPLTRVME